MQWTEYKNLAIKTLNPELTFSEAIQNMAYGLIGEIGEVVDLLKKLQFHGHSKSQEFDDKLIKEIGDVCWYSSVLQKLIEDRTQVDKSNLPAFEPSEYKPDHSVKTNTTILFMVSEIHYATSLLFTVASQLDKVECKEAKEAILEMDSIKSKLAYSYISTNRILYACMDLISVWTSSYGINYALYENHKKLLKRYGGNFSVNKSMNRGNE